jgi:amino acid adenylation domain-containing protein
MSATLTRVLLDRVAATPDRLVYRFLPDNDAPPRELTYAALYEQANAVAYALQGCAQRGDRVLVLCPPGADYLAGLWGCFLAGMVAVPALPPRFHRTSSRFDALLQDSDARVALTTAAQTQSIGRRELEPKLAALRFVSVDALERAAPVKHQAETSDLVVLQYTSGSTSTPRGVMLDHANLIENCRRAIEAAHFDEQSELISWLPPYHDMGLIGTILLTVVAGCRATMMSPFSFVTRPARWLEAITRYRGTHAGAPDFGFSLCTRRVTVEQKRELDLSSWQVAWNGAERVRGSTLDAFARAFEGVGFSKKALRPCYGLAEATLIVSFSDADGPHSLSFSARALGRHQVRPPESLDDAQELVSAGRVVRGHAVSIVDPETRTPCARDQVGEIWVRGRSVAHGYWNRAEYSAKTFGATHAGDDATRWLRTGDLGFVRDAELFVTGRSKDVIIVAGRNHYPDDIEHTVQSAVGAARASCGAAFAIERDGQERACLVQEVDGRDLPWEQLAAEARASVFAEHELVLDEVIWLAPGKIAKTSSGKVQRSLMKQRYLEGTLAARARSVPRAAADAAQPSRLEPIVARACCELLDLASIERSESLFALGASSVIAMQLAARLEHALGVEVPLRWVFEAPSVAALARALERATPLQAPSVIDPKPLDTAPLSLAQERMWFEHSLDPGASAYNISGGLRIRGQLAVEGLVAALRRVVARHPVLSARYELRGTGVVQRLAAGFVPEVSLRDSIEPRRDAEALAREPFDLTRDAVIRLALLRIAPDDHLLVTVIHHIAADGLSTDILFDEIFRAYVAPQAELPRVSVGYLEFAAWQRSAQQSAAEERDVAYFSQRLRGAPTLLALPLDKPRPPRRSLRGALVVRELSPPLVAALDRVGQELRATRYMTLLSAFYVLLARSSGERDISVGTPVAGRRHAQVESSVGTFINMLVMRTQLERDESFASLLGRVRALVLEGLEHQDAPFERVVEAVLPARSQAYTPLFHVMFDYQVMRKLRTHGAGLTLEPLLLDRAASQYDLSCSVIDAGAKTLLHLEYRSDLFERASAERLADRYLMLLESALAEPGRSLDQLPWLGADERAELLSLGRGPEPEQPAPACFLAQFEAWAARAADAPAVRDAAASLSYSELAGRANQLAHHLRAQGVTQGARVAVCLERSVDLLVALLGVLEAGGCYVPLDPAYPEARIAYICESAQPKAIIVEEATLSVLSVCAAPHVLLEAAASQPRSKLQVPPPSAEQLAYIIYTSGSTGRPKGVEVPHGALANFLQSMAREPGLGAGELLLAVTTVSFDIHALELFLPLIVGGRIEIASRALAADGPRLARRLEAGDVRCFQATPATYRMLVEAGFVGAPGLKALCGGEALSSELAKALLARGVTLYNMYGPTETTVWSACAQVTSAEGALPLGRAIDNTTLYVLDAALEPVPKGVVGELYIGGVGVARGYHGNQALTDERFVPDRFGHDGRRMYRTGDAVRFRHDGRLEFVGRVDQQVKLRGFRIELGEIEAQLEAQASVEACAVRLWQRADGEARLVAYLVARAGHTLEVDALRAGLRSQLPDYMVPTEYVALKRLPHTPNGKVDRSALPAPEESARIAAPHVPPRDEVEAGLCALFEEILKRSPVGIHESFFDLGGHSMLAVRLFEELYARTGVRLPLSTLFGAATVAEIAARMRELRSEQDPEISRVVSWGKPGAQQPQVVFVHPLGTGSEQALDWYRPLAQRLEHATLAVTCEEDAFLALQEVAARHVSALATAPRGSPICLVGLGLGGNVAQEMARQLEDRGCAVRRVVVIESVEPRFGGALALGVDTLREVVRSGPTRALAKLLRAQPGLEDDVDPARLPLAYRELSAPQWNALLRHEPRPCRAPIVVVHGKRSALLARDPLDGFTKLSLTSARRMLLRASEQAAVETSAHDELVALLEQA